MGGKKVLGDVSGLVHFGAEWSSVGAVCVLTGCWPAASGDKCAYCTTSEARHRWLE